MEPILPGERLASMKELGRFLDGAGGVTESEEMVPVAVHKGSELLGYVGYVDKFGAFYLSLADAPRLLQSSSSGPEVSCDNVADADGPR